MSARRPVGMKQPTNASGERVLPYMPFYVDRWLTSDKLRRAPVEVIGAVIQLLAWAWKQEDCTLPDDDEYLADVSSLGARWPAFAAKVRAFFPPCPGQPGMVRNAVQYSAHRQSQYTHDARVRAGQKGGRVRHSFEPPIAEPEAELSKASTYPNPKRTDLKKAPNVRQQKELQAMLKQEEKEKEKEMYRPSKSSDVVVGGRGGGIRFSPRFERALRPYHDLRAWAATTTERGELLRTVANNVLREKGRDGVGQYLALANQSLSGMDSGVVLNATQLEAVLRDFLVTPGGYALRWFRRMIDCGVPLPGEEETRAPNGRKLTLGERQYVRIMKRLEANQ